jgi:hypothetical protein
MLREEFEGVITEKVDIKTPEGKDFNVTAEGSLGLLALGAKGLIAWRQKRMGQITPGTPWKTDQDDKR